MRPKPEILSTVLLGLAAPAAAQLELPLPLVPTGPGPVAGSTELAIDPALVALYVEEQDVTLRDFPTPDGAFHDLALRRSPFDPAAVGVFVDGVRRGWDPGDLTLWAGELVGVPGSDAFLALSSRGCYGWIFDGVETTHLTSTPGVGGDWSSPGARIFDERALVAVPAGRESALGCGVDSLVGGPTRGSDAAILGGGTLTPGVTLDCRVAVETDYQLYQVWNDLAAEQNYVIALLGAASARYFTQVDVVLTYPYVMFYTTPNDPWSTPDSGGTTGQMLDEFRNAWANNIPGGARLAHFLSGAALGGGIAYLDVLCDPQFGFGVSSGIDGGVSFPVQQGSNTWDFYVLTHEIGHNFGSPHTHDYCPPIDQCSPWFGQCQNSQVCISTGTIMSYCHQCAGGMNNITTYFHPTVTGVMRAEADASCLPDWNKSPLIYAHNFEGGDLSEWAISDPKRVRVSTGAAFNGTYGARLKKGGQGTPACTVGATGKQSWMASRLLNTVGYTAVEVRVQLRTTNLIAL